MKYMEGFMKFIIEKLLIGFIKNFFIIKIFRIIDYVVIYYIESFNNDWMYIMINLLINIFGFWFMLFLEIVY